MPLKPQFTKFLEGKANALRSLCELRPFDRLDPFALAAKMKMKVHFVGADSGLPPELLATILRDDGGSWDAGTIHLPDGSIHVFMHPNRPSERQHSTLMEEVSHIHLGHKPTEIITCGPSVFRTFNKSNETQAYWVGAAALLPARILKGALTLGWSQEDVAEKHMVSNDLVRFRCNLSGVALPSRSLTPN
jgi:hypothetical protein